MLVQIGHALYPKSRHLLREIVCYNGSRGLLLVEADAMAAHAMAADAMAAHAMAAHISILKCSNGWEMEQGKSMQWHHKGCQLADITGKGKHLQFGSHSVKRNRMTLSIMKVKLINAMNLIAFVSLKEFYQWKLRPSELVSVFHTAAVLPETTSK